MSTTTNLAEFGAKERHELIELLQAWEDSGLPDDFYDNDVVPMFNKNSGYVFLTNSEYDVCMAVDGKLESFYTTPYSGHEGFYEDLLADLDSNPEDWEDEDIEYLKSIAENRNDEYGINLCDTIYDLKGDL